jgi:hypothetical protein
MTKEELKIIFNQKKQKTERKISKKGIVREKLIAGFNLTTFDQFYNNWFNKDHFEKGCSYCGTTNKTSVALYKIQREGLRPDATRGGKRGKRLELDRVDPNLPYDNLNNIVWCCYWCNNAKSNFFTKDEFLPIANEIGKAIKKIMEQH